MIGEFLKAEMHSSRFRAGSLKALEVLKYNQSIIENPDYISKIENEKRVKVLGLCRGWPNENLFVDFPSNTEWFYASMDTIELRQVYRLKSRHDMTEDERRLTATAEKVKNNKEIPNIDNNLIRSICEKIEHHVILPLLIMVSTGMEDKKVLIEGHSRSVAYCVCGFKDSINIIIGISSDMQNWDYY